MLAVQAMRLIAVARRHRDTYGEILDMQEAALSVAEFLATIKAE